MNELYRLPMCLPLTHLNNYRPNHSRINVIRLPWAIFTFKVGFVGGIRPQPYIWFRSLEYGETILLNTALPSFSEQNDAGAIRLTNTTEICFQLAGLSL